MTDFEIWVVAFFAGLAIMTIAPTVIAELFEKRQLSLRHKRQSKAFFPGDVFLCMAFATAAVNLSTPSFLGGKGRWILS
jgi:hypothetical protein